MLKEILMYQSSSALRYICVHKYNKQKTLDLSMTNGGESVVAVNGTNMSCSCLTLSS